MSYTIEQVYKRIEAITGKKHRHGQLSVSRSQESQNPGSPHTYFGTLSVIMGMEKCPEGGEYEHKVDTKLTIQALNTSDETMALAHVAATSELTLMLSHINAIVRDERWDDKESMDFHMKCREELKETEHE